MGGRLLQGIPAREVRIGIRGPEGSRRIAKTEPVRVLRDALAAAEVFARGRAAACDVGGTLQDPAA